MTPPPPRSADARTLAFAGFLRGTATGCLGVVLGLYLARRGLDPSAIGLVLSAGLTGAALATGLATLLADRFGRRRSLMLLALAGGIGTGAAALLGGTAALALAAFLGMVNGMGRDRGAALALEQAVLPETVDDRGRTRAFAVYHVLQDVGHGLGAVLAALPELLALAGIGTLPGFQWTLGACALLQLAAIPAYARLSAPVEMSHRPRAALTPASRGILLRVSALFLIDSIAGGFLLTALLAYFFAERFGVGPAGLAALFLGARVLNALSHLGAAWLAARIGLVNTMVFTHLPSSVLLALVPFAPDFTTAALLFLLREGLVEMDVPTRQSYVMAVMRPEERSFASGVTHLVRLGGWAVAPAIAGVAMQGLALAAPLWIGAGMKVAYDLMLWRAFRGLRPPEERGEQNPRR